MLIYLLTFWNKFSNHNSVSNMEGLDIFIHNLSKLNSTIKIRLVSSSIYQNFDNGLYCEAKNLGSKNHSLRSLNHLLLSSFFDGFACDRFGLLSNGLIGTRRRLSDRLFAPTHFSVRVSQSDSERNRRTSGKGSEMLCRG